MLARWLKSVSRFAGTAGGNTRHEAEAFAAGEIGLGIGVLRAWITSRQRAFDPIVLRAAVKPTARFVFWRSKIIVYIC